MSTLGGRAVVCPESDTVHQYQLLSSMDYQQSGVDIAKGGASVGRRSRLILQTRYERVLGRPGAGFTVLELPSGDWRSFP